MLVRGAACLLGGDLRLGCSRGCGGPGSGRHSLYGWVSDVSGGGVGVGYLDRRL